MKKKYPIKSEYICSQCGPDKNGSEIHAMTHHVFPPYTVEEAKKEIKSRNKPSRNTK